MKAVGYIRVSTNEQAKEGYSLAAQQHRIKAYCQARGFELAETYADEGISAVKKRPAFDQMVTDVLSDGVKYVVALKLDRFGRSAKQLLDFYEKLEKKGTSIVTIEDGVDTSTAAGRLMRTVLAGVVEFEREQISERTKEGLAEARRQGTHLGRLPYRQPNPQAQEISEVLRGQGHTLRQIAEELQRQGIPSPTGQRWWPTSVKRLLIHT